MGSEHIQIPVYPPTRTDVIAALSDQQLRNRDILDPRYQGFDPHFDWRTIVDVQSDDPTIAPALDKMTATPLGQHILRQGFAIHQALLAEAEHDPAVRKQLGNANSKLVIRGGKNTHSDGVGIVTYNSAEIASHPSFGLDGTHRITTTPDAALFHEFAHLADAFGVMPAYSARREDMRSTNLAMRAAILNYAGMDPTQPIQMEALTPQQQKAIAQLANDRESTAELPVLRVTNDYLRSVDQPERSLVPQFILEQQQSMHPVAPPQQRQHIPASSPTR